jgi:carboxymethylenebutenolidase
MVPAIKAPLLLHYAEHDDNIDRGIPAYVAALKANNKRFTVYVYPGAQHGFNDDTAGVRYNKKEADIAWGRTIAFFRENLGAPAKAS